MNVYLVMNWLGTNRCADIDDMFLVGYISEPRKPGSTNVNEYGKQSDGRRIDGAWIPWLK